MKLRYCPTCDTNRSQSEFSQGASYCIYCRAIKYEESKMIFPVESFECILRERTFEEHICEIISYKYNYPVTVESLKGEDRKREIVFARGLAMLYRNKVNNESQAVAAGHYNKGHATLINAKKVAYNMWDTDPNYRQVLQMIETRIGKRILKA